LIVISGAGLFHLSKDEMLVSLTAPSGVNHFSDQRAGFNNSLDVGAADRANYDIFVSWISEGALCGRIAEAVCVECVR